MFGQWEIPSDICDTRPINKDNLSHFVGRASDVTQLRRVIDAKGISLVEGELGRGKTSLGNVSRIDSQYLTPTVELQSSPSWSKSHFIRNVLSSLVLAINSDPKTVRLRGSDFIKELMTMNVNGADEQILIHYLRMIPLEIKKICEPVDAIIVQMNNLDLGVVFTEAQLSEFLNDIRDVLQTPGYSWILCGHEGIASFIRKKVKRFNDIIDNTIMLKALSCDELSEVLQKRSNSGQHESIFPMETSLVEAIYKTSNFSLRATFSILKSLLIAYCDNPLVQIITIKEAKEYYLALNLDEDLQPRERELMDLIITNPGESQKELLVHTDLDQSAFSKYSNDIEMKGLIRKSKSGKAVLHYPSTELYLANYALPTPPIPSHNT